MILYVALLLGCTAEVLPGDSGPQAYHIFSKPGEFMIGGLFPFHSTVNGLDNYWKPEPFTCSRLNPKGLVQAIAMEFTLEEINNSTSLLPGQTLGYEVYDTCLNSLVALHPVLLFLARNGTEDVEVKCNLTNYKPRVMSVIGPSSDEVATVPMKLFSTFLIPQISYSVTADIFSDKSIYPAFFRTVPSDSKQVSGMVELMTHFKWNWIAAVASEDDYGEPALRQFSSSAMDNGICIAYEGLVPLYLSDSETSTVIEDILDQINQPDINVVLVFSSLPQSIALFKEVIMRNMTKVWIGSASWILSDDILTLPGIERIGTVIGFFPSIHKVLGFEDFLRNVISQMYQKESDMKASSLKISDGFPDIVLEPDTISTILHPLTALHAQSVYTAVYSMAHALHRLLNCTSVECNRQDPNIYPWKLLKEVRNVNFSVFNTTFKFDSNGNPYTGYDIVTHSFSEMGFIKIGSYNNELNLENSLINWGTPQNLVPKSQCSLDCLPGQIMRVKGTHSCCFDCIDCLEGTFQSGEDTYQCHPCPKGQWSSMRSTSCSNPTFLYLKWSDTSIISLLLFSFLLLSCVLGTLVLFFKHRHSPLVQASGGYMSFLTLVSLGAVLVSMVLFVGKPVYLVCLIQQPFLAMSLTCCLSTFSIKALQVMLVTDFRGVPIKYLRWLKSTGTWVFLLSGILIQGSFCTWYIISTASVPQNNAVNYLYKYLKCEISNVLAFFLMFGYNGVLALISFMLNCVAHAPPGQYNLARDITFSTLLYLLIWIIFVPAYAEVTDGNQVLLQMAVTLLSSLGIMLSYFAPKCYILLFNLQLASEEYFKMYNN